MATPPDAAAPPAGDRHSAFDDAQAIFAASALVSLGLLLLARAGLLVGGMAGVALLLARVTPFTFGKIYAVLNLPFFFLALRQMGRRFTLKTFVAIFLVSFATDELHRVIAVERLHPGYAAVAGGLLVGTGLLILFRHQACLGGFNILALWLQRRGTLRAGLFQMAVDSLVVLGSFLVVPPATIALSVLAAVILNAVLAVNHRPGRYLGT